MDKIHGLLSSLFPNKEIKLINFQNYDYVYTLNIDEKKYLVKIIYKRDKKIIEALDKLFIEKTYLKVAANTYMLVEPFVNGQCFDDDCQKDVTAFVKDLKKIHSYKIKEKDVYSAIKKRVILLTKNLKIKGLKEIINYIKNYKFPKASSLIHEDIQPKNVLNKDESLFLFDYENMRLGHPYDDFSYLYLFSEQYPNIIKKIITTYFDGNIPSDFHDLMSHFVVLRYLMNLSSAYKDFPQKVLDNNASIILKEYVHGEIPTLWK